MLTIHKTLIKFQLEIHIMTMAAGHLAIDWTPPVWKYGRSKVRLWLIKVGLLSVLRQLYCQHQGRMDLQLLLCTTGQSGGNCTIFLCFPNQYCLKYTILFKLILLPTFLIVLSYLCSCFLTKYYFFKCQVHVSMTFWLHELFNHSSGNQCIWSLLLSCCILFHLLR